MSKQTKPTKEANPRKFLNHFYEKAKDNLLKDGHVYPQIFLFLESRDNPDVMPIPFFFSNQDEKETLVRKTRVLAKNLGAWGYVTITESWMVKGEHLTKEEHSSLKLIPPSRHPKRKEAVFVAMITKDWTGGKAAIFEREEDKIKIVEELSLPPDTQMTGLFADILK